MANRRSDPDLPTVEQELSVVQAGENLLRKAHAIACTIDAKVRKVLQPEGRPSRELPRLKGTDFQRPSSN